MSRYVYILLCWALLGIVGHTSAQDHVWIEGEAPTTINVKPNVAGGAHKEFLSGEKWLHLSIDADKVEKETPPEGILIKYDFTIKKESKYEVWNRIGFEFVRTPFAWRIDGEDWTTVSPEALTTDLMELDTWAEVAWLKLGDRTLKTGAHALEIKIPRTKDDKGKTARILYSSDALCLYAGTFHPNGKHQSGADWRNDQDRAAAKHVFKLPAPSNVAERSSVALQGVWEVCRNDEQMPGDTAKPIKDFPAEPHWTAIPVPGDRNEQRPDLLMAHRLWYRTRVEVPESLAGRSFHITFPENNLNTTVFVNGTYCGFNNTPYARFSIDVTAGIKPGVNEVWVGIRDAWYGYSTNPKDPLKLRKKFNLPLAWLRMGFQDLAYSIWSHPESGILTTPEFVAAGPVVTTDVFAKPSVSRKELAVDVTIANRTKNKASGEVLCEVLNADTGKIVKALPKKTFTLDAGAEATLPVSGKWTDPQLWWPDQPNLYSLRTTVSVDGRPVDVSSTTFGFREWTIDGKDFKLNGLVWHGWCDQHAHQTKEEWLAFQKKTNQSTMRFWGTRFYGLTPEAALDFFDRNGIVVRRSGILDGEAIGYNAVEHDPDLKKESPIKMDLMRNWREQVVAQVKGERNHPSVNIWSIENEWLYINCINLHGGEMDFFEAEVLKTSDAVRAADPTRPTMTDGGGANKANTMPVHGNHYVGPEDLTKYPAKAYEMNPTGGGRGRWVWDQKRPRYLGEDFYAAGLNAFDYSTVGGEEAFQGKVQARPTVALVARMLTEGYRWAEFGAWDLWLGQAESADYYTANAPRAALCRQWDWTFNGGQKVTRTLGVFNDSRFEDPITVTWTLNVAGKKIATGSRECALAPGSNQKFDITLELPPVEKRQDGELVLALTVKGAEIIRDVKPLSVLPRIPKLSNTAIPAADLLVFDPSGSVQRFLKEQGIPATTLADLKKLPEAGRMLIVGKDALDAAESTSSHLAAWASAGHSVIVLEQKHPLRYQGLPAEMEAAENDGRVAFPEDTEHPVFAGLKSGDFFTWSPDEIVYRNAYGKPTRGGKSLAQCHHRLANSALVEVPAGKGLLLLCQLVVGEKLADNAVARQLLLNLISYGAKYKLEYRPVAVCAADNPQLVAALDGVGLQYSKAADPVAALAVPGVKIAVVSASPANLKALADNRDKVEKFTKEHGYILFNGLAPEGLKDYNRIVGVDHMIRPFRQERVTFPAVRNPLTAGLSTADIVMQSGKRINDFNSDVFIASDVFSYVVDYDEVAPFAKFPDPSYFGYKDANNDHNPLNMVNGFVSADGWQYIFSIWAGGGVPNHFSLKLPKEQEITEFEWIGNAFYNPVTRVELTFDRRKDDLVSLKTQPNNQPQTFTFNPPRKGSEITINLAEWQKVHSTLVIGVDNIRFKAKRSPEFYQKVRPLLNLGAMMEYRMGSGGVVLCNVLYQERETLPENAVKKRAILAALLRNLRAPFSGGQRVIAGANLKYDPVDISKQANQYRDERGWFGDKATTFKDLPSGKQVFAGVPFHVYEFATSPVPNAIMLDGPGVPNKLAKEVRGIPVDRKADALFFLQTARLDARRNEQESREKKTFEMARYIITYADGQTVNVPIIAELDVDDYRQKTPAALPGAQLGWTRKYEGSEESATAYVKQWDNPRPDVAIKSIDLVYGEHKRGVPVLLAVTAAKGE
jgi:beta-galactosidase